jgi:hypothetical protein
MTFSISLMPKTVQLHVHLDSGGTRSRLLDFEVSLSPDPTLRSRTKRPLSTVGWHLQIHEATEEIAYLTEHKVIGHLSYTPEQTHDREVFAERCNASIHLNRPEFQRLLEDLATISLPSTISISVPDLEIGESWASLELVWDIDQERVIDIESVAYSLDLST